MNPVITAVDAGHYQRSGEVAHGEEPGLYCRADGEFMPCAVLRAARGRMADYSDLLRQAAAIEAGKLSVPAR